MTVKQISVFVENKPGKLAELTDYLHQHDIDMRALSIAETQDFGIVRMIVDDAYKASQVLKESGYVVSITPVGDGGVNLDYTYAFLGQKAATAYMVLRVEDNEKAIEVLSKSGIRPVCQDTIAAL